MDTAIWPKHIKMLLSFSGNACHKQGGENGKLQAQRQTHDRQLSHPGNYSSHTYSFERGLFVDMFSPQATWKVIFMFKGGITVILLQILQMSQHTAFVNSQPMISSFAHETVENKNISIKMDFLSDTPTLNGWSIKNSWIFTFLETSTVTLASCWVCHVGTKLKTKGA